MAKYIIGAIPVDPLKLQKLLYYCQAVHLARLETPLFDDQIEAWRYGPVIPEIYNKYKNFGFDTIVVEDDSNANPLNLSKEQIKTIDMVLEYYGEMSAIQLVNETHNDEPWKNCYEQGKNAVIGIDAIQTYYKRVLTFS